MDGKGGAPGALGAQGAQRGENWGPGGKRCAWPASGGAPKAPGDQGGAVGKWGGNPGEAVDVGGPGPRPGQAVFLPLPCSPLTVFSPRQTGHSEVGPGLPSSSQQPAEGSDV